LVSPANLHSTKFSIITITRGRYNRPFSGRRPDWTQYAFHPPLCELLMHVNWILSIAVNCCWPSPALLFLVLGPVGTHDQIFVRSETIYAIRRIVTVVT
jgi:hypothetical protein